jgi:hypothetical protein
VMDARMRPTVIRRAGALQWRSIAIGKIILGNRRR